MKSPFDKIKKKRKRMMNPNAPSKKMMGAKTPMKEPSSSMMSMAKKAFGI